MNNPIVDSSLPPTADIVIIGGGPAGASAAWALHRAEPGLRVLLIEKTDRLGAGSSLASLECYRTCWPAVCLAAQMRRSVEVFHRADETLGEGAAEALSVRQRGYLFCAMTETHAATLRQDVARLRQIGFTHIEYLDADEVAYRFPWVGRQVIAAKFDPVAGWLDSNALIHQYVKSAHPRVLFGIQDAAVRVEAGRVTGVATSQGMIASPKVIIAAGADAIRVGRTAGVELPVVVRPRQSFTTPWRHQPFPDDAPLLIGGPPFPHGRPEARVGAIFGWEYRWNTRRIPPGAPGRLPDALVEPVFPAESLKDPRFPSIALALLARQFGHTEGEGFANSRYLRGARHNIGYYVSRSEQAAYRTTPDGARQPYESERAIIDAAPGVEGLFVSIAHVGHGVMTSPAAGEIIACKALGRDLPDPSFAAFGFDAPWVEYDSAVL